MRLVRLAQQPSRVAEDVRAALASFGQGDTVVGGIALIGVRPFENEAVLDAVVVLPRGILSVIGVDLPDPVMLLEAPLYEPWKADGWPLTHADDRVNPASKALATAETVARKLTETHPCAGAVVTVIAVGPFVDRVEQPPADLASTVRVLHPTMASMLAVTKSLVTSERHRSVSETRALLQTLSPETPELSDEILRAEGFCLIEGKPTITSSPESSRAQVRRHPAAMRWLPIGAIVLLAILLVSAIVVASGENKTSENMNAAQMGPTPSSATGPPPSTATNKPVKRIQFSTVATGSDQRCASHGFGDIQTSLQRTSCNGVRRGSFSAKIDGRPAAVTVAIVEFSDLGQAEAFKVLADTPGSGEILDIAAETGRWPGKAPSFHGAAGTSSLDGSSVRLARAVWLPGPSTSEDLNLLRAAKSAVDLPLTA